MDADTPDSTTPIYDISGKEPVLGDMPHSQVHDAIASGKFSFPNGQDVPVVAPDGTHGTIPADQAPGAFGNGYQYATPEIQAAQADQEKYGTVKQQVITGLEGGAQGLAGFLAPAAERALGVDPQDIRKRAEQHPWIHGISEGAGFIGGIFTGASEASAVGHVGEAAATALQLGGEGAGIASRIAAGAVKAGTEMSLIQASDEATKAILDAPSSIGQAAINIGLSGLLGGVTGGTLTGTGMALKAGYKASGLDTALKEFTDRLAYRGSNLNPNEAMQNELREGVNGFHEMGSEVGGSNGLKAQALQNIMPEMGEEISQQAQDTATQLQDKINKMRARPGAYPEHLIDQLEEDLKTFNAKAFTEQTLEAGTPEVAQQAVQMTPVRFDENPAKRAFPWLTDRDAPPRLIRGETQDIQREMLNTAPKAATTGQVATGSGQVFDALNELKQKLHAYNADNYGISKVQAHDPAYRFLNEVKGLGHAVREGLENPSVWGEDVAGLQTGLNKAWSDAIPAVKDIESKFMTKVGRERVVDPAKFNTYVSQNGRATSPTIRQQMMGNFVEAIDSFQKATADAYEKAGLGEYPRPQLGLGELRDSIQKKSPWARLADLSYDRMASQGAGDVLGGITGGAIGHATGIPEAGFAGAYLGKWALGPVFSAIIKPVMTKSLNVGALQQAVKFSENVIKGNSALIKASADLFSGAAKTIPQHFMPDERARDKLNKSLEYAANNPASMFNVGGDIGHYMPDHQAALAQHAQNAVTYLNGLRPKSVQAAPLDTKLAPSKDKVADFNRQLDIAQQPLLVIQHIKNATLLPQDIATLKTIYPALYPKMVQQVMSGMTDHLSKEGTIPYRMRQSLSQFVGQPLDSTMMPSSIMAIQSHYQAAAQQAQAQGAPAPQKSTAKLSKIAMDSQTPSQAREQRSNKA